MPELTLYGEKFRTLSIFVTIAYIFLLAYCCCPVFLQYHINSKYYLQSNLGQKGDANYAPDLPHYKRFLVRGISMTATVVQILISILQILIGFYMILLPFFNRPKIHKIDEQLINKETLLLVYLAISYINIVFSVTVVISVIVIQYEWLFEICQIVLLNKSDLHSGFFGFYGLLLQIPIHQTFGLLCNCSIVIVLVTEMAFELFDFKLLENVDRFRNKVQII